jgi:hypothetical protein
MDRSPIKGVTRKCLNGFIIHKLLLIQSKPERLTVKRINNNVFIIPLLHLCRYNSYFSIVINRTHNRKLFEGDNIIFCDFSIIYNMKCKFMQQQEFT